MKKRVGFRLYSFFVSIFYIITKNNKINKTYLFIIPPRIVVLLAQLFFFFPYIGVQLIRQNCNSSIFYLCYIFISTNIIQCIKFAFFYLSKKKDIQQKIYYKKRVATPNYELTHNSY